MNLSPRIFVRLALAGCCALTAVSAGCQNNPFTRPGGTAGAMSPGQTAALQSEQQKLTAQIADLNRRLGQVDGSNGDLTRQMAEKDRQIQASQEQVAMLQKQLGETASKLKESLAAKQDTERKINAFQASTQFKGGAAISANNSVRQSLQAVNLPGLEVRQDGELIRIEIPADRLFTPGTAQPTASSSAILDEISGAIARSYARQRIVIEGHGDGTGGASAVNSHSLAGAQAQAVFQQLVQRGRLPARQLSMLSMGDNHPLAAITSSEGRAKNRRIEIVVYPDTFDG